VLSTYRDSFFKGVTGLGIATLCFGVIAGLFAWIYILRAPDEAHGVVYAMNLHGSRVYVTKAQFLADKYAFLIDATGIVMIVIGRLARGKTFPIRGND
jgi:hypothetical protein